MYPRLLLLIISVSISSLIFSQDLSNKGKEFWVGYGHNQIYPSGQTLVLYLSAEQAAQVTISVNGTSWSQTYTIPANTVIQTVEIPKNGASDARLTAEGISDKGIHIVSDVPIVAYAHQYGSASSGATMLMPVETYGYTYYSLNYTQVTNATPAYSWFFVIASQDNTVVEITPSRQTQGGHPAGVPFTVNLNKGQIYNVFGQSSGTTGQDMTGSKIVSKSNLAGECFPIAVFSGMSRITIVGSSGGEFCQQQIFPASAWGTKYLTAPTSSTASPSTYNLNVYRIAVRNPNTVVKRNGVVITGLQNNFYYEFQSNQPEYIEADKAILVAQYMVSSNTSGFSGLGDPEMFYLSPIEQAQKKVAFYSTNNQSITSNYVTIVIPSIGLNSLKIDGQFGAWDLQYLHPRNFSYRVVVKALNIGQHTIECDSTFTAIVYGQGSVESYGYNAGTLVNNLDKITSIQNEYSATLNPFTCINTSFNPLIKVSYKPSQIVWRFSNVNNVTPNTNITQTNPTAFDSSIINGRKYFEYRPGGTYKFTDTGNYVIPISVTATDIDNCGNTETINLSVRVNPGPKADFTWIHTGCRTDTVFFNGIVATSNGFNINRFKWTYPDASTDSVQNPKKILPNQGANSVKLEVIAENGCVGDTTKIVTVSPSPINTFGMNPDKACGSATVTFTDTSSFAGGPIHEWYWDFGNGNTISTNTNSSQTQLYNSPGSYTIKHYVRAGTCGSDTTTRILRIFANPVVNFTSTQGCLQDSTVQFTNSSSISDGQGLTYSWNFGDPNANAGNPNTSTQTNPTHKYSVYGTYPVQLIVTTANGCSQSITIPYTVVGFGSAINYSINNQSQLCSQNQVQLTNNSNVVADSVYKIEIYWDWINQPTVFDTDNSPTPNKNYFHSYNVFTTPSTKTFTVKWRVYSKGGCVSEKLVDIILNAKPVLIFNSISSRCINVSPESIAFASVTNGVTGTGLYSGTGINSSGVFNPSIAGVGLHSIKYVYTTSGGCVDSITQTVRVFDKPTANFNISGNICERDSILITNSSTISAGNINTWNWNFGDASSVSLNNGNAFKKNYSNAGNYIIKLVVISDSGCISDTLSKQTVVFANPQSSFNISSIRCADSSIVFTTTSTFSSGVIQNWYWNFGNGNIINANSNNTQTQFYITPGVYDVKHVVSAQAGCVSDTAINQVTIFGNPVVTFTNTQGCLTDSIVQFTNNSSVVDAQTINYGWNFGDANANVSNPNTSTSTNPSHKYIAYGNYVVSLTANTTNGCAKTFTKTIRIDGLKPNINFDVLNENSLCSQNLVKLVNRTPIIQDSIYRIDIFWDAANQPLVFTSDLSPAIDKEYSNTYSSFTSPATKSITVKWVVYSKGGCITEFSKTITLHAKPVLLFNTLLGKCVNSSTLSIALATVTNGVAGTGVYSGNGVNAAGNFDAAIAGVGLHTIKYVFNSSGGCSDSISQTIRVFPKPTANFNVSGNVCLNDSIQITDASSIASGTIQNWNYDFGDATNLMRNTNASFYKTYSNFNTYSIKLFVSSDSACNSDTVPKTVTIHPLPQTNFQLPTAICLPNGSAVFTNLSTIPNGNISQLNFIWNFGDGNTSTSVNPTHSYAAANNYNVTLTATSSNGCVKDSIKQFSSFFPKPIAKFGTSAIQICEGKESVFTDSSSAQNSSIVQWQWNFGNGNSSSLQNPKVTYALPGAYNVSLIVKNNEGCESDTIKQIVTVHLQPIVDAGAETTVSQGQSLILKPAVNNSALNLKWTPSLYLNSDIVLNPTSTPLDNIWYKLTATGSGGCFATDSVLIKVLIEVKIPNAFSPNGDGINDVWNIKGLSNYTKSVTEIFDRNGNIVFRSIGYSNPWDGNINGKPAPVAVYYYIIEPKDRGYGTLTGSVTLLR